MIGKRDVSVCSATMRLQNPCIGEISVAPFYAVKMIPSDIATYHGMVTDEQTRVLDTDRKPIPGLFAVGNDAASIFGGSYPGAGATLGPAMTFGYIRGRRVAADQDGGIRIAPHLVSVSETGHRRCSCPNRRSGSLFGKRPENR